MTVHNTDNRIIAFSWAGYWNRYKLGPENSNKEVAYERTIYSYKISYKHWANSPKYKSRLCQK